MIAVFNSVVCFPLFAIGKFRNKRKLLAVNKGNYEENPRNNQARDTIVARNQEDCITQVSKDIDGGVTRKLFQEFSRTKSSTLGALSQLDEFLLNAQARFHSGLFPESFPNLKRKNQEAKENCSQNDRHPEMGVSLSQSSQEYSLDQTSYRTCSECSDLRCFDGNLSAVILIQWNLFAGHWKMNRAGFWFFSRFKLQQTVEIRWLPRSTNKQMLHS